MSKVSITRSKLDTLANTIAAKSGVAAPLTLDQMDTAVRNIPTGGITPSGNINITQAGVTDVTNYATATVPQGEALVNSNEGYYAENGNIKWHYQPKAGIDAGEGDGAHGYLGDFLTLGTDHIFNVAPSNTTVTPTTSSQTIGGANYMMQGAVTVAAMPSGTEGTPTATKGSVSNHAVTVTPSVTNSAGYISGGTKTGTAVTVSASELVSGSETKTANGTYDVTNLASLVVNVAASGANIDTKTITASNYPTSISFSSMKGTPKAFFLRSTSQISSSGSTTYYYIIDLVYDGNANNYCDGNCFRIGSTRRVDPITTAVSGGVVSGYTWSYSGSTLTITSSASSRSASPGAFNNGYKLVYIY